MPLTKAAAANLLQKATAIEEDLVTINRIFFKKFDSDKCMPYSIGSLAHFNSASKKCQKLFASEILYYLSLYVRQSTVKSWKVSGIRRSWCGMVLTLLQSKELTLIDIVMQERRHKSHWGLLRLDSISILVHQDAGERYKQWRRVHLAMTATVFAVEEHSEGMI